jgi:hypothetical protein
MTAVPDMVTVMMMMMRAGVPPRAVMMRPCRSRSCRGDEDQRTCRQRKETKRPAERNQLNHTQSSLTPPLARRLARTDIRTRETNCVWREQDAMRQRKIDFGVILGSFHDGRNRGAPHCRREH